MLFHIDIWLVSVPPKNWESAGGFVDQVFMRVRAFILMQKYGWPLKGSGIWRINLFMISLDLLWIYHVMQYYDVHCTSFNSYLCNIKSVCCIAWTTMWMAGCKFPWYMIDKSRTKANLINLNLSRCAKLIIHVPIIMRPGTGFETRHGNVICVDGRHGSEKFN